jgi:hypothetical protein
MVVCSKDNRDCMTQACQKCKVSLPSKEILRSYTQLDTNEDVEWMTWRKSDKSGLQVQRIQSTVELLLEEFDHQWSKFVVHYFITSQQCRLFLNWFSFNCKKATLLTCKNRDSFIRFKTWLFEKETDQKVERRANS